MVSFINLGGEGRRQQDLFLSIWAATWAGIIAAGESSYPSRDLAPSFDLKITPSLNHLSQEQQRQQQQRQPDSMISFQRVSMMLLVLMAAWGMASVQSTTPEYHTPDHLDFKNPSTVVAKKALVSTTHRLATEGLFLERFY